MTPIRWVRMLANDLGLARVRNGHEVAWYPEYVFAPLAISR